MKRILGVLIFVCVAGLFAYYAHHSCKKTNWTIASQTKIGANLQEVAWTASFPQATKHMKVGLRMLSLKGNLQSKCQSKASTRSRGVVVYLPPSGASARLYTDSENYDFRIYLANRGYDVFSVDYRSSFIPEGATDISVMAGFKTSVTLNDIHEAIKQVKFLTGAKKVFLAGHSTGARYVYLYAASKWADDLAGMIPMDGSPWESDGAPAANATMNIDKGYAALKEGDTEANRKLFKSWGLTPGALYYDAVLTTFEPAFYDAIKIYYAKGPNAASPVAGFATVSDYIGNRFHFVWGRRQLTNVRNGTARVDVLLDFALKACVKHWPLVDYMEDAYIGNWNGNPPVADLQFTKNIGSINIPILVFASSEFTDALGFRYEWKKMGYNMVKSKDRQYILLNGFGHLDVLLGEQAKDQVYTTLYNWLETHK
jgi:pimeloyl-ACP methyl ester carboxylesterase